MLGIFFKIFCIISQNRLFQKFLSGTLVQSNCLDPDPYLGPNCLQRLSADVKCGHWWVKSWGQNYFSKYQMQAQSVYFVQPLDSSCAINPTQTMCGFCAVTQDILA